MYRKIESHVFKYITITALLSLSLIFTMNTSIKAANKYVRKGAVGSNNGSDWANAWSSLNDVVWVRGDTVWIAGGVYKDNFVNIKIATNGTERITFMHATIENHGTSTGWDNSYGNQTKIWGDASTNNGMSFYITEGYITIDGAVRNEDDWSDTTSYGIVIYCVRDMNIPDTQYGINFDSGNENGDDSLVFKNIAFICWGDYGNPDPRAQIGLRLKARFGFTTKGNVIEKCFFIGGSTNILSRETLNMHIRNCYFDYNYWGRSYAHGQSISTGGDDSLQLYNNYFVNTTTFVVGHHTEPSAMTSGIGWNVYNNLIINSNTKYGLTAVFANAESTREGLYSWQVHHNTAINVHPGARGFFFTGRVSDTINHKSYCYNNLFYNSSYMGLENGNYADSIHKIVHDHNAWFSCDSSQIQYLSQQKEVHSIINRTRNPFIAGTYSLSEPLIGKTLFAPFNYDFSGIQRGTDGIWDIGAYEFGSGEIPIRDEISDIIQIENIYPNPFYINTRISYILKEDNEYQIIIFNIHGQIVKQLFRGELSTGQHSITWDKSNNYGGDVSNGVYFVKISSNNSFQIGKVVVVK